MKEASIYFKEILGKGLVPKTNTRNVMYLTESKGAFPFQGVTQALQEFDSIDVSALPDMTFPYPQMFFLSDVMLLCTPTAIYEYDGTTLTLKISGLTEGTTWSYVDFKDYIWLTNGIVSVTKNTQTRTYAIDATVPHGTCLCNFNGQVFIGSPDTDATGNI